MAQRGGGGEAAAVGGVAEAHELAGQVPAGVPSAVQQRVVVARPLGRPPLLQVPAALLQLRVEGSHRRSRPKLRHCAPANTEPVLVFSVQV